MCTVGVPPGAGLGNTTLRGKSDEEDIQSYPIS